MLQIVMAKKGVGTIELLQNAEGYFLTANGIKTQMRDADALNAAYKAYRSANWEIKSQSRDESPMVKSKQKKESKPRFIWCRESKMVWAKQAELVKKWIRIQYADVLQPLKGKEYHAKIEGLCKEQMDLFESHMAPILNPIFEQHIKEWKEKNNK